MGTVRLSVNDENSRTILPTKTDINDIVKSYIVIFLESDTNSPKGKTNCFKISGGIDDVSKDYLIALGWYKQVIVHAYSTVDWEPDSLCAIGEHNDEFEVKSTGIDEPIKIFIDPFDVSSGKIINKTGYFDWDIDDSANDFYSAAEMTITPLAGTSDGPHTVKFLTDGFINDKELYTGIYNVSFEFGRTGYSYVKFSEILYIAPGGVRSKYNYTIPKLASTTVKVYYNLNPYNPYVADISLGTITVGSLITGEIYTKLSAFITDVSKNDNFDPTEVFKGWYKDKDGTKAWNFSYDRVLSDTTLYAKWEQTSDIIFAENIVPGGIAFKKIHDGITSVTFTMGSPTSEPGRNPDKPENETQHSVTLTNGFYMGKYPVTQEQWEAVMGNGNPSGHKTAVERESGTPGKLPVENLTWYDVVEFCNKLSASENLFPVYSLNMKTNPDEWGPKGTAWDSITMDMSKNGYRLPTEAEWEYACRAGEPKAFNNENNDHTNETLVNAVAWYNLSSGSSTHKVGLKQANKWGLYDMHGNVYEWCWDWFIHNITAYNNNPTGPATGTGRVLRGGSFAAPSDRQRSAYRNAISPAVHYGDSSMRLVRGF
jgi:uncharacterized repeat protein (TIGR02543 family)